MAATILGRRARLGWAVCALATWIAPAARAQLRAQVLTAGSGGQHFLAVGFDSQGRLLQRVCSARPCALDSTLTVAVPEALRANIQHAEIRVVPVGQLREAVWIRIAAGKGDHAWHWLAAAPLRSASARATEALAPQILFSDWTGAEPANAEGPTQSLTLSAANARGHRSFILGTEQPNFSLCGRKTALNPKLLDPESLSFLPAKVQHLDSKERARAPRVQALAGEPLGVSLELQPTWASSGNQEPALAVDGDPETAWFEGRAGDGYGEFLVLRAPHVPITGLTLVLPAAAGAARAPTALWVATVSQLIHVDLPLDSGSRQPLQITFPEPITGDCIALVLDRTEAALDATDVGIAEVTARAAGIPSVDVLISDLGKTGEAQQRAVALLVALGKPALAPLTADFRGFNEAKLSATCDVLDRFSCADSSYAFARLAGNPSVVVAERAQARLRMCGRAALPGLERAFSEAQADSDLLPVAAALANAEPEVAVRALGPRLVGPSARRASLRVYFARAARARSAAPAVRQLLSQPALAPTLALELLRALGPYAATFMPEAGQAYSRARSRADFATRYLLLEPAGYLAAASPRAHADLAQTLAQKGDWRLRAQAASSMREPARFQAALVELLGDPHVRVRQAALGALSGQAAGFAEPAVVELLLQDSWPLVRIAAAEVLGSQRSLAVAGPALLEALEDPSVPVRAAVATALAKYPVREAEAALVALLEDSEQQLEVRIASALALGNMCATSALGPLTVRTLELSDPAAPGDVQLIGKAALAALVRLNPSDLKERLATLTARTVLPPVRAAVGRALQGSATRCGRAQPQTTGRASERKRGPRRRPLT